MTLRSILVIILLSVQFNLLFGQANQGLPFMKYYSTRDYNGGIQNWSITQNRDGLIYAANNFGLLEFDGNHWKRYPLPNETKMRDVSINPDGKIYVAAQGDFGYFLPDAKGIFKYTSLADSLPPIYRDFDETWKVFLLGEKTIFCTFNEIFIFSSDKLERVLVPDTPPERFFFINNTLFISQIDRGLTYVIDGELKLFDKGEFFKGKTITGLIPLVNNHMWISTLNSGIFTYDGKKFNTWHVENNEEFMHASVNDAKRIKNGNIAIGTQSNGLYITTPNGSILQHLNKEQGLNNRTVLNIFEDIQGNLWLGHNNGITMVELNLAFSLIGEHSGLPGTGYDGLLFNNKLYLGTNNGLYVKDVNDKTGLYKFIKGTEGQVYKIQNIDDQIIIGHHLGAFLIDKNDKAIQISDILGMWTFQKLKNHPEYIIAGNYKGLFLFRETEESIEFVRKIKGFEESSRVIEQDENGNIWMTHGYKGVYRLNLNDDLDSARVTFYGRDKGFPSNILINVWRINNRLIFSAESQIYRYDEDTDSFVIDEFYEKYFDANTRVNYMEQDVMGNIYYLANNEIGELEKLTNGDYKKNKTIFNSLKGLMNDDLQNLAVLNSNEILFAAKEGFVLYSKNTPFNSEIPYKNLIRNVSITNQKDSTISTGVYRQNDKMSTVQTKDNIPQLPYLDNSIRIEYSAPFMHTSTDMNYQYILDGVDKEWSDWTTKTDKEYTNLHEGNYTFRVRAKNIYEKISEEAVYSFKVLPPWYRTNTAFVIYTLTIILSLSGLFYMLEFRHKKEKKLMALKQRKEIRRIDSELRSTEEEVQQLRNEKLLAQVEVKNKELTSSTVHLLNKNSFINSVKHNISTIIKRSKNKEVQFELSKIMNNIDKNISQDKDWENFAIHFDQVHGDFTTRIQDDYPKLTPQEMKLSVYLRMNLSSKEIAHLLNISLRGVEIARYRLRKKLELERSNNLQEFILKY